MRDDARAKSRAGPFDRGLPEPRWRRNRVCCVYRTMAATEEFALNIVTRIPEMAPIWGVSNSPHLVHAVKGSALSRSSVSARNVSLALRGSVVFPTAFERSSILHEIPQTKKPPLTAGHDRPANAESKFLVLASSLAETAYGTIGR